MALGLRRVEDGINKSPEDCRPDSMRVIKPYRYNSGFSGLNLEEGGVITGIMTQNNIAGTIVRILMTGA
jgi:hypothetical protein